MKASSFTSSSRATFATRVLLLLVIVIFLDHVGGSALESLYFSQISGLEYRTRYAMEEADADLMIFGSSRANHHYVPSLLEEKTGMSVYNCGRDDEDIVYGYAVLSVMLKHHTPRYIILDLTPEDVLTSTGRPSYPRSLRPYYGRHPEIKDLITLNNKQETIKMYSRLYRFNSLLLTILKYNVVHEPDDKGYTPRYGEIDTGDLEQDRDSDLNKQDFRVDPLKEQVLHAFIRKALQNRIRVVLIASPIYRQDFRNDWSDQVVGRIAARYRLVFWDDTCMSGFTGNPRLFYDRTHLNDRGAHRYTQLIANRINASFLSSN